LIFIKAGFLARALYAGVSNFISERTRGKFTFAPADGYIDILKRNIDSDQIPRDYGGSGQWLADCNL